MNLDFTSLVIGLIGGGILATIISSIINKNSDNQRQTQLALESQKLEAANQTLFETQKLLIEKSQQLVAVTDEVSMNKARLENAIETFRKQEEDVNKFKNDLDEKNSLITEHYGVIQQLKAQNEGLNDKLNTLRKEIDDTRKTFETEFKNMAQTTNTQSAK